MNVMSIKTWAQLKDEVFGVIGEPKRDKLEKEIDLFRRKLLKKEARRNKLK